MSCSTIRHGSVHANLPQTALHISPFYYKKQHFFNCLVKGKIKFEYLPRFIILNSCFSCLINLRNGESPQEAQPAWGNSSLAFIEDAYGLL